VRKILARSAASLGAFLKFDQFLVQTREMLVTFYQKLPNHILILHSMSSKTFVTRTVAAARVLARLCAVSADTWPGCIEVERKDQPK
jgi:hypothetical protein